jgi:hypothetical protein
MALPATSAVALICLGLALSVATDTPAGRRAAILTPLMRAGSRDVLMREKATTTVELLTALLPPPLPQPASMVVAASAKTPPIDFQVIFSAPFYFLLSNDTHVLRLKTECKEYSLSRQSRNRKKVSRGDAENAE